MITEAPTLSLEWLPAPAGVRLPIDVPFGRLDLVRAFAASGLSVGAEIGVESGEFSAEICRANLSGRHYAIDAWRAYRGYREHVTQEKLDGFYEAARARLAAFPSCHVVRAFSLEASERFKDGSLDYVYIDANHDFAHVVADLAAWVPKVRSGGVVAGHDFIRSKGKAGAVFGVVDAVTGWTRAYDVSPWYVLRGDRSPSWYWVKP